MIHDTPKSLMDLPNCVLSRLVFFLAYTDEYKTFVLLNKRCYSYADLYQNTLMLNSYAKHSIYPRNFISVTFDTFIKLFETKPWRSLNRLVIVYWRNLDKLSYVFPMFRKLYPKTEIISVARWCIPISVGLNLNLISTLSLSVKEEWDFSHIHTVKHLQLFLFDSEVPELFKTVKKYKNLQTLALMDSKNWKPAQDDVVEIESIHLESAIDASIIKVFCWDKIRRFHHKFCETYSPKVLRCLSNIESLSIDFPRDGNGISRWRYFCKLDEIPSTKLKFVRFGAQPNILAYEICSESLEDKYRYNGLLNLVLIFSNRPNLETVFMDFLHKASWLNLGIESLKPYSQINLKQSSFDIEHNYRRKILTTTPLEGRYQFEIKILETLDADTITGLKNVWYTNFEFIDFKLNLSKEREKIRHDLYLLFKKSYSASDMAKLDQPGIPYLLVRHDHDRHGYRKINLSIARYFFVVKCLQNKFDQLKNQL